MAHDIPTEENTVTGSELQRWLDFEHRDGFYAGFICGVLAMAVAAVTIFVILSLTLEAGR